MSKDKQIFCQDGFPNPPNLHATRSILLQTAAALRTLLPVSRTTSANTYTEAEGNKAARDLNMAFTLLCFATDLAGKGAEFYREYNDIKVENSEGRQFPPNIQNVPDIPLPPPVPKVKIQPQKSIQPPIVDPTNQDDKTKVNDKENTKKQETRTSNAIYKGIDIALFTFCNVARIGELADSYGGGNCLKDTDCRCEVNGDATACDAYKCNLHTGGCERS